MIGEAVLLRYSRIDIFLLIGLPAQTLISVRETWITASTCSGWEAGACRASSAAIAGAADLGAHAELRDPVDDSPRVGGRPPTRWPSGSTS